MRYFKTIIGMICILIFITGCNNNSNRGKSTDNMANDFLSKLESSQSETEGQGEDLFPVPSSYSHWFNILDEDGNGFSQTTVTYSGGRVSFDAAATLIGDEDEIKDEREYNVALFILVDGYIQPYYLNGSDTAVEYTKMRVKSSEQEERYAIAFDPIYVPYGESACVSLIMVIAHNVYYDNPNTVNGAFSTDLNFLLTADTKEHEVPYEKKENLYDDLRSDFDMKDFPGAAFYDLSEKITDPAKQFVIRTCFDTKAPLYLYFFRPKPEDGVDGFPGDVRLFYFIDGDLIKAFHGEYYLDMNRKSGQLYEIPMDMNLFKKGERHLAYAVIISREAIAYYKANGFNGNPGHSVACEDSDCYNVLVN